MFRKKLTTGVKAVSLLATSKTAFVSELTTACYEVTANAIISTTAYHAYNRLINMYITHVIICDKNYDDTALRQRLKSEPSHANVD